MWDITEELCQIFMNMRTQMGGTNALPYWPYGPPPPLPSAPLLF